MCLDPLCPFVSLLLLIRLFREFYNLTEEWNVYRDDLKHASAIISDLDLHRKRLSCELITGGWEKVDNDINTAKLALDRARKVADWRDEPCSRAGLRTGMVEFAFKHKAAIANGKLVKQYLVRMDEIRQKFIQMDRNLEIRRRHLRATKEKTYADMAKQYSRRQLQLQQELHVPAWRQERATALSLGYSSCLSPFRATLLSAELIL
jgi:hypothetical protein